MANRKPPSRFRYEASHPVISFRTNKELQEKASRIKEREGISNADIFRMGIEKYEINIEKEEEIYKKGFQEGSVKGEIYGITTAQEVYMVTYRCSKCGGKISIDTPEQVKAASRYMEEHGWHHNNCRDNEY